MVVKFNSVSDTLKLNLLFFSVSVITQLTFLNSLYHKGHDLMFKDEVISDKALIIVGLNIFLIALCILYSFILNKASPRLPKSGSIGLLEKISVLLSSLSTIVAAYLTSLFVLNREFTDFVNLPFGFKLHFNWTVSERLEYIRDILKERAVPEPVDLELRVRGTTSMDSIRDLAKSVEQSHIEKLRAAIEAKARIGVDVDSSGVLDDMNNWMHAHSWEIAATCAFICAVGVTISLIVFVHYADKIDKLDKTLADLQSNVDTLDKNIVGLAESTTGAIDDSLRGLQAQFEQLAIETKVQIVSANAYNDKAIKSIAESIASNLKEFEETTRALKKVGELSKHEGPYPSTGGAVRDLAETIFQNQNSIERLAKGIKGDDVAFNLQNLSDRIAPKLGTVDEITRALLESKNVQGNFYTSAYEGIANLARMSLEHQALLTECRQEILLNRRNAEILSEKLTKLLEGLDSSSVSEQAAVVASAISESGL